MEPIETEDVFALDVQVVVEAAGAAPRRCGTNDGCSGTCSSSCASR